MMKYEKGEGRLTLSGSTSLLAPRPAVILPTHYRNHSGLPTSLQREVRPYGDTGIVPAKLRLETGITRYPAPRPKSGTCPDFPLRSRKGIEAMIRPVSGTKKHKKTPSISFLFVPRGR